MLLPQYKFNDHILRLFSELEYLLWLFADLHFIESAVYTFQVVMKAADENGRICLVVTSIMQK